MEHIDYALEIGLSGMNDPAVEGQQQLKVAHIATLHIFLVFENCIIHFKHPVTVLSVTTV